MKLIKNIYFLSALMVPMALTLGSCTNEEDDIFDASSAVRLEKAKSDTAEALCAAPNGWILQYFPSVPDYSTTYMGGYNFHFEFKDDESVTVTACNALTSNKAKQETSVWEMIADNGPVLTLNSYNTLFHEFSNPTSDGTGYGGDYEFIIMKLGTDTISLRGKKTGIDCPLIRLEAGVDPATYLTEIRNNEILFSQNAVVPLTLSTGAGENYDVVDIEDGLIAFVPENGDAISQTQYSCYLYTDSGIRFISSYKGQNDAFAVQTFKFNDAGQLICQDEEATISMNNKANAVSLGSRTWTIDRTAASSGLSALIDEMEASIVSYNSSEKQFRTMTWVVKNGAVSVVFRMVKTATITYPLNVEISGDGSVSISYDSSLFTSTAKTYFTNCPGVKAFLDGLCTSSAAVDVNHMVSPSEADVKIGNDTLVLTR